MRLYRMQMEPQGGLKRAPRGLQEAPKMAPRGSLGFVGQPWAHSWGQLRSLNVLPMMIRFSVALLFFKLCHVPGFCPAVLYVHRRYLTPLVDPLPYDVNMRLHPYVRSWLHTALK